MAADMAQRGGGTAPMSEAVRQALEAAGPQAVEVLVQTMRDQEVKPELRVKCAEAVMDRLCGKTALGSGGGKWEVVLGEAERYAD